MEELLKQIQEYFNEVKLNPQKAYEETNVREKNIKAARVLVNGMIVDILDQDEIISVWVNNVGSKKETTVQGAFEFLVRQIDN